MCPWSAWRGTVSVGEEEGGLEDDDEGPNVPVLETVLVRAADIAVGESVCSGRDGPGDSERRCTEGGSEGWCRGVVKRGERRGRWLVWK